MNKSQIAVKGEQFPLFAGCDPETWCLLIGMPVEHRKFGSGVVKNVEHRKSYTEGPLVSVWFEDERRLRKFNNRGFHPSHIFRVCIPCNCWGSFSEWQTKHAIECLRLTRENIKEYFLRKKKRERQLKVIRIEKLQANTNQKSNRILSNIVNDVVKIRFFENALGHEDLELICRWAKSRSENRVNNEIDLVVLQGSLGQYELARLYSARAAEKFLSKYYRNCGSNVEDISFHQLKEVSGDWKTHDLMVDERPIDVKNSRRAWSSKSSYSEHCVPRFKVASRNRSSVSIAGVLSDLQSNKQIFAKSSSRHTMLGELSSKDIVNLENWFKSNYCHVLEVGSLSGGNFFPGWMFEYIGANYPDWAKGEKEVQRLVSELERDIKFIEIPKPALALLGDEQFVNIQLLTEQEREFWKKLRCLFECLGYTRRSLFSLILGETLSHARQSNSEYHPRLWYAWLFCNSRTWKTSRKTYESSIEDFEFEDADFEEYVFDSFSCVDSSLGLNEKDYFDHDMALEMYASKVERFHLARPLGLIDSELYIYSLIRVLGRMWDNSRETLASFSKYRLRGPNILQGMKDCTSWTTILAYCGGWKSVSVGGGRKVKCGKNPIYLGSAETCKACGRLICPDCGYCQHVCAENAPRQLSCVIVH